MGKAFIQESTLTAIANAIRGKNGSSDTYLPSEMPQAITNIPSSTPVQYNVLCFTAQQANSTVYIRCHKDLNINLQCSYDNENWTDWTFNLSGNFYIFSTIRLTNIGNKVYIRGHNGTMGSSISAYSQFFMTGNISASGNIQSLLTYEANSLSVAGFCYYGIFRSCTALTTAPELPATALANNCYTYMFYGCTSLYTAPELPATTLASGCYVHMFSGCTNLNYIKVGATSWNTTGANNWVQNVASTGNFYKPTNTSITTGASGIPSGWTVYNE